VQRSSPDPRVPNSQFHSEEGGDVASCNIDVEILDEEGDVIKPKPLLQSTMLIQDNSVQVYINISNTGAIPVKLCSSSIDDVDTTALAVGLLTAQDIQLHPGGTLTYTLGIAIL